jgi:hypothetical protein
VKIEIAAGVGGRRAIEAAVEAAGNAGQARYTELVAATAKFT